MAVTDFIAAVELASSQITAIAGKKNADGTIQILAYASEPSSTFIKKGVIYNLDRTTQGITSVIGKLEEALHASIGQVYVGIGGQSVRTVANVVTRKLTEQTKISQAMIDAIMDSNRENLMIDQEILDVEPQEYKVDNNYQADPVGIPADYIEGHFLNIIARNTLKRNINKCFVQAGYNIADYFISPLVTANLLLTDNEKRSGCALIDFGADTTTVAVYKSNILRHLAVIPLGSNNITKDIASLQIEEEDAEALKIQFGSACTEASEEQDENKVYTLDNGCSIQAKQLEEIIEARITEIIANVWNQILLSEYGDKLLSGVILTGGGSNLRNIDKAFTKATNQEKVRIAKSGQISFSGSISLKKDGSTNTLVALLVSGQENCYKPEEEKEDPAKIAAEQAAAEAERLRKEREEREEQERKEREEQERIAREQREKEEQERKAREEQERKEREEQARKELEEEYNSYLKRAERYKNNKEFAKALEMIERARSIELPGKEDELQKLENDIKHQKGENSPISKLKRLFTTFAEDLTKDE